ncbi:inorganic diphosphatase [Chitinophaga sp. Ak27]|uniref:inorganic diphosphatase n=2 Tax=Chitinophaga TaxID=79328 RepID=UPI00145F8B48|nr:inorganic diphosphatase [Chitinophaga sp. Ak27]NLU96157.1 inorganic diphosphatase [Chitinophaga sp. Ak27]
MSKKSIFVTIESPKGSREKFDYDPKNNRFLLKKILPMGMFFPFDYGFIPGTRGEDGDPLDAFVLSDVKTFPGCVIECKLLGAIKAEQRERDGTVVRNDRYLFTPVVNGHKRNPFDGVGLEQDELKELVDFFVNYNEIDGKKFRFIAFVDAKEALRKINRIR